MTLRSRIRSLYTSLRSRLKPSKSQKNYIIEAGSGVTAVGTNFIPQEISILQNLPDDVLLFILQHLDCISLLQLSATCQRLRSVVNSKTVWLDALESMLQIRPVPLSYRNLVSRGTTAELPLQDVKKAVVCAQRLNAKLKQPIITPIDYRRYDIIEEAGDELLWAWNLDVGRYLMTYSQMQWFSCTIYETHKTIRFQTVEACCWDFDLDTEGITVVFNSVHQIEDQCMEVYRIDLVDASWSKVKTIPVSGLVQSNILEDEIAGCLVTLHNSFVLHIVNWRTRKHAIIETGIPSTVNLSASTTKAQLLFCYETTETLDSWFYDFSFLKECVEKAGSPEESFCISASPQYHHQTQFANQGLSHRDPLLGVLIPTTRGMWTGQQCLFSYLPSWGQLPDTFTYSLIPDVSRLQLVDETRVGTNLNLASTSQMKETKSISRRSFIYKLPENTWLSSGAGWRDLYAIGCSGKHAVWLEQNTRGKTGCRLATFSHDDEAEEGPTASAVSTVICDHEGFDWDEITSMVLDDNAGILTCTTHTSVWNLYFYIFDEYTQPN